jgi:hypothetical protein
VTHPHILYKLAFASIALACQSLAPGAEGAVTIDLDRASYSAGSRVELRLTNHTNETLGYNACMRALERLQDNAWVAVAEPGRVCTRQVNLLSPHSRRTAATDLPASLARGTYRLVLIVTRENVDVSTSASTPRMRAVSQPFQVE